jgi:hypothetical protein
MPADLELDAPGRRLRAALAALLVRDNAPELRLVRDWLDNWSGIGVIVAGMTYQGWDVQLPRSLSSTDRRIPWRVGVGSRAWAGGHHEA